MSKEPKATLVDSKGIKRSLARLAHEILENTDDLATTRIIGIRDRGDHLAQRLANIIKDVEGEEIPIGFLISPSTEMTFAPN